MPEQKFNVGDKVIVTGRVPIEMKGELRKSRARTIVKVEYSPAHQATIYYVGSNYAGVSSFTSAYPFRSYQLKHYKPQKTAGRPRVKRKYRKKG